MKIETSGAPTPYQLHLTDLAAAALLVAEGCRLVGVVPSGEPGRQAFVVEGDRSTMEALLGSYERGDAVVTLESFVAAQRRLKERLFRSERLARGARG